jgi:signal transduction histidine kinase
MVSFLTGLVVGLLASGVAGTVVAVLAHRRQIALERRTVQAERLAELGTLTGGLAHEIKNPLSTISLNLQLLAEDLDPRDEHQARVINRLHTVQREAGRLKEILDDFLRFAGKVELSRQPTDLNELVEELSDFLSAQAQMQKVQLRLKKSDRPIIAEIDPKLIKQAVLNLMINALQAMPDGGELILSANAVENQACIDVIDTGPGIPEETLGSIFKAYYSTKKSGTGLGLAISQRIVLEHGGKLDVRSEVGKGTDFKMFLPLSISSTQKRTARAEVPLVPLSP